MVKKAVIIGLGGHARGSWLKTLSKHEDWEVSAIVDTNTELLENIEESEEFEGINGYTNIDQLMALESTKPDLAVIATPIYTHHILVQEAMDHGLNVICEKNMASNIYQARQMVQAAIDNPELCTAVGTQYRYFTRNWVAKQFFAQENNPIGELANMRWTNAWIWGEKRTGWRRWLQDVYLEDMATHMFDSMRYITGMDIIQVKADAFIPKYSSWKGSSSVYANFALAHPDDYNHRHNWTWCQFYGDWQPKGPIVGNGAHFYCQKGQCSIADWGMKYLVYTDDGGSKFKEDGFLMEDAGSQEGLNYDKGDGQSIIAEMMSKGIDSKGKYQPGTNFKDAIKSFAVSQACIESSRTNKTIWVPDYWKDMDI